MLSEMSVVAEKPIIAEAAPSLPLKDGNAVVPENMHISRPRRRSRAKRQRWINRDDQHGGVQQQDSGMGASPNDSESETESLSEYVSRPNNNDARRNEERADDTSDDEHTLVYTYAKAYEQVNKSENSTSKEEENDDDGNDFIVYRHTSDDDLVHDFSPRHGKNNSDGDKMDDGNVADMTNEEGSQVYDTGCNKNPDYSSAVQSVAETIKIAAENYMKRFRTKIIKEICAKYKPTTVKINATPVLCSDQDIDEPKDSCVTECNRKAVGESHKALVMEEEDVGKKDDVQATENEDGGKTVLSLSDITAKMNKFNDDLEAYNEKYNQFYRDLMQKFINHYKACDENNKSEAVEDYLNVESDTETSIVFNDDENQTTTPRKLGEIKIPIDKLQTLTIAYDDKVETAKISVEQTKEDQAVPKTNDEDLQQIDEVNNEPYENTVEEETNYHTKLTETNDKISKQETNEIEIEAINNTDLETNETLVEQTQENLSKCKTNEKIPEEQETKQTNKETSEIQTSETAEKQKSNEESDTNEREQNHGPPIICEEIHDETPDRL